MAKKKSNTKPMRFATLIRVSTEQQERQGESLRTQDKQLSQIVENLGGKITARYGGQEHATAGWERAEMDKLLRDAAKQRKPFDAVIVTEPTRWSRENISAKTGLDRLRANGITFFAGAKEYDLFDPRDRFILELSATIGALQAGEQKQKSVQNKIERAKRGIPTGGSLPWGRTFDKQTGKWALDKKKQKIIRDAAQRYLAGESIKNLAAEYGIDNTTLHQVLTRRSGRKWSLKFSVPDLAIDETVEMEIPPLLDERTIKAIKKKVAANKTYTHGHSKYQYLFSRVVFCAKCNSPLTGQTSEGVRYYRHIGKNCLKGFVRADDLEEVVIRHLFEMFGNPQAVQKAIEEAMPEQGHADELRSREEHLIGELGKIAKSKDRILGLIERDKITDDEADKRLDSLNDREAKFLDELSNLQEHLAKLPDIERIVKMSKQVAGRSRKHTSAKKWAIQSHINHAFDEMTFEAKRALAQAVFSGKMSDGRRMGVYVDAIPGQERKRPKKWAYKVRGLLVDLETATMTPERLKSFFEESGGAPLQKELLTTSGSY